MAHKVVQPENIRHAEIDPLQSYTLVATGPAFQDRFESSGPGVARPPGF